MLSSEAERYMAEYCYGYGRWNARFYFIGLQQGQAKEENNDLTSRYNAFRELQQEGLCDCRAFHQHIGQPRFFREGSSGYVPLQSTWRKLMLAMFGYKGGHHADKNTLRSYQASNWGSATGETCVVDLSGLAANNLGVVRDREAYVEQRMRRLLGEVRKHQPAFVLIYGKAQHARWERCLRDQSDVNQEDGVWRCGSTKLVLQSTPKGQFDHEWVSLGLKLRAA